MSGEVTVRIAEARDIAATLAIYNHEVETGIATFDLYPKSTDEWREWFARHNRENHPLLVAELDGELAGYACLSPYRERGAFRPTVELSVYVDERFRCRGVASALLARIIEAARADERTHAIVSVITAGNEASRRLHEKFGFTFCGTIREAGIKHGAYRDIENYELLV